MKKIECEACGSNDLLKQGDYFVCQNCGCKYTVEDVRKMMIEGTVEVKGTVSIDTSNKEQALLDYCEASYKNNLRSDLNQNAMKLLEINPKLWQGWFYRGVCNETEITVVNDVMEPKMAMTFYNQAFELAKGEDKKKLADTLYPRLTSLILKRFNYIFHSNYVYKINVEKANAFINEIYKLFKDYKERYSPDYISSYEAESKISVSYLDYLVKLREPLKKQFIDTDKSTSLEFYNDQWATNNIDIVNKTINFLNAHNHPVNVVEGCYDLMLEICRHLLHAHGYEAKSQFNERIMKYEEFYVDKGPVLDKETQNTIKEIWNDMKEVKPTFIEKSKARDDKYHKMKNDLYWSSHKEEKEKLESELNGYDAKVAPYKEQIEELDEDIAQQKALLEKPLKEEEVALALKQEAEAAQTEFKKLGLFDKKRKSAKEEWQKKAGMYESAQKKANDARTIFNTRINGNIKELEAEKAKILKALSGIEKEFAYIKEELTKNR